MLNVRAIEVLAYRVPLATPVRTSFGRMRDRPAVLVRVDDADGHHGWGEAFCNWPAAGAEHRARLIVEDLAELVFEAAWPGPEAVFADLTRRTHVKVLQTGEAGPFAQAIAALDQAAWTLAAAREGRALHALLAPGSAAEVGAYASGIAIGDAAEMIPAARADGFRAFKVKVGFDIDADAGRVREVASGLEAGETLMADANQAWDLEGAQAFLRAVEGVPLAWLEEPMPVDAAPEDWRALARTTDIPLAGGENLPARAAFARAIAAADLTVIQPDVAKWGGIGGCLAIARETLAAGLRYCPHFLGAGVGLLASAHLLAAAGGDGMLEIDVNPNPLRTQMTPGWPALAGGRLRLPDGPGLGIEPVLGPLDDYLTYRKRIAA